MLQNWKKNVQFWNYTVFPHMVIYVRCNYHVSNHTLLNVQCQRWFYSVCNCILLILQIKDILWKKSETGPTGRLITKLFFFSRLVFDCSSWQPHPLIHQTIIPGAQVILQRNLNCPDSRATIQIALVSLSFVILPAQHLVSLIWIFIMNHLHRIHCILNGHYSGMNFATDCNWKPERPSSYQ